MNPFQSDNIWKKKARQGKAQQHPLTPQQEWQKQVNSSSLAGRRRGAAGTVSGRCPRRHRGAGRKRRRADRGGGLLLRIHCRIPRQADEEQAGGKGSKEEKESQKRVIVHLKWLRVRCAINSGIIIFVYCKAGMTAVIPALLFHGKGS